MPTKRARLVLGMGAPRRDPGMVEVPLLGKVAAGAPLLAMENVEDSVRIDSFLLGGNGKEVFALRVKGESMIEDGIHDGDYLFVRKTSDRPPGRHRRRADRGRGHAEALLPRGRPDPVPAGQRDDGADLRPPLRFRSTMILGLVVGVYRKLHG